MVWQITAFLANELVMQTAVSDISSSVVRAQCKVLWTWVLLVRLLLLVMADLHGLVVVDLGGVYLVVLLAAWMVPMHWMNLHSMINLFIQISRSLVCVVMAGVLQSNKVARVVHTHAHRTSLHCLLLTWVHGDLFRHASLYRLWMIVRLGQRGCLGLGSTMTSIGSVAIGLIAVASRARSVIIVLLVVNAILTRWRLCSVDHLSVMLHLLLMLQLHFQVVLVGFFTWDDHWVGRGDRCHWLVVRAVIVPLLLLLLLLLLLPADPTLHVEIVHRRITLRLEQWVSWIYRLL